jgi:DNA-binding response OmpR family regulator
MEKQPIGILIADDHPVVRIGLRNLLEAEPSFSVLGEAADGKDAIDLAHRLAPDVMLLDLAMPRVSGLDVLRELTTSHEPVNVILLTASIEKQQLVAALRLGARGLVMKDSAAHDLVGAIQAVSGGQYWIEQQRVGDLVDALENSLSDHPADSSGLDHIPEPDNGNRDSVAGVSSHPPFAPNSHSRSSHQPAWEERVTFGDVVIDFSRMELTRAGQVSSLTKKQFEMLRFLWRNPERVISRQELLNEIWGYSTYASTRIVDSVVLKLRHMLEKDPAEPIHLRTVHGMGYRFVPGD